ncbi:MAG: isoamylase [Chloroflexota bacterium]
MEHKYFTGLETIIASCGRPERLGATVLQDGINFALASARAVECTLVLFRKGADDPFLEIPIDPAWCYGQIFTVKVQGLSPDFIEYGYRVIGPELDDVTFRFDEEAILNDPYARKISGLNQWRRKAYAGNAYPIRSQVETDVFDWEGDRPLKLPLEELVIYEMHVRGFTQHPTSGVLHPGTYAGLIEKIPYLLDLGVNCVELLPIHEFDEHKNIYHNPETGEPLVNFWGYSTLSFFAPKAGYAASGVYGNQNNELKEMIKALHLAGIEVWLDVVYNHTGEGGDGGPHFSFRGIDNKTYYLLTPSGDYLNYSGTGNTFNCNHPLVRRLIVDSLRYWVLEYHIDGFRFDLASILTRDDQGRPLGNPPIVEEIAKDPVLANTKIVAEAWDAGGLYQVGTFPHYGRWSEWNGKYRDSIRRFIKGDIGLAGPMVQHILGSPDIYIGRSPLSSVNFVTCHDGFTLFDLYSYNHKHNDINGEGNRDGTNDNNSWNSGVEGPTDDPDILRLRFRLIRGAIAILMLSQGVPMIHMGDEIAHSKQGNNNTYAQDNELNWVNWDHHLRSQQLFRFFKHMIAFRKAHPILRNGNYMTHADVDEHGFPSISWHGIKPWMPDWSFHSHTLAFLLCEQNENGGGSANEFIYVAINMHWESHFFEMPELPAGYGWFRFADTDKLSPQDIVSPGSEVFLTNQRKYLAHNRSVVVLVGRPIGKG